MRLVLLLIRICVLTNLTPGGSTLSSDFAPTCDFRVTPKAIVTELIPMDCYNVSTLLVSVRISLLNIYVLFVISLTELKVTPKDNAAKQTTANIILYIITMT